MSDLMTIAEVATWLRCNVRSLYRYIKRDGMPAYRLGSRYKFKRSEIEAWMKARATRGHETATRQA